MGGKISKAWIQKRKELVAINEPGPSRDEMLAEIEAAEAQLVKDEAVEAAAREAGAIRNNFAGKRIDTGDQVPAHAGFAIKVDGRWRTLSWDAAVARWGAD